MSDFLNPDEYRPMTPNAADKVIREMMRKLLEAEKAKPKTTPPGGVARPITPTR